ncbi:Myb-like domain, Myb/SANT-like DNA-binding domain protein [Tanacetum coccineum]
MGSDSTSNSAFPGFSSQTPMTPEQFAFLQTQQEAFIAFQQTYQNISTNPPQQQSQSSKGKEAKPTGEVTLRWSSDEEALLAECFVAVSEDRNVGRSHAKDTFWVRVVHEFNRKNFKKRTKDMLTSKWTTLNPSLPKVQRNIQKVPSVEKKWRE